MNLLAAFIEMMVLLLLYNSLFNKGKMDKLLGYSLIVLVCSIVFVSYNTEDEILLYLLLLIPEIIAIAYIDKKNINLVLMEILISIILTFIIQSTIIAIIFFITGKTKEYLYIHLLIYAIITFLIIILMKHFKKLKDIDLESYIDDNLLMSNVILNIFTFFMILRLIYHSEIISNMVVIEIIGLIFVNILFNISFYKNMHKKIIRNKNMEVKNAYNPLLDEIIQNIKANEHEYKNHIGMLFSMIQVSNSIPELKERAEKYIGNIQNTNILSKVLDVESTIIKSVL